MYLNLEQTLAKKAHEENEERRKNQPKKTILEMYRTIGAVNGPGWRPKPDRPVLETSVCLMLDPNQGTTSPVKAVRRGVLDGQGPMRDMGVGKPTKLMPIEHAQNLQNKVVQSPWSTQKYSNNNSGNVRAANQKGSLGIFASKKRSQGMISPPQKDRNAKAGTFAFGSQVQSGRSVTVKPAQKKQNLQF